LTSEELAWEVFNQSGGGTIGLMAAARILGPGNEQYSHGKIQKFESMSIYELTEELKDEILDAINYLIMASILIPRSFSDYDAEHLSTAVRQLRTIWEELLKDWFKQGVASPPLEGEG